MILSKKIKNLRKIKNLSKKELASRLKVDINTISKWEKGSVIPNEDETEKLCKVFDVSKEFLLDDAKDINTSEDFKPRKWLLVILIIVALAITAVLINRVIETRKNRFSTVLDSMQKTQEKIINNRNVINNSTYEFYIGTKTGTSVSYLLDEVIKNNKTNKTHMITVVWDDVNTTDPDAIKDLKKKLDTFKKYETSADYDDDNNIYKITIEPYDSATSTTTTRKNNSYNNSGSNNKTTTKMSDFDKDFYNSPFEFYVGTKAGLFLDELFNEVITNNKTNSNKIIVSFNGNSASDESTLKSMSEKLLDTTKYYVSINYNSTGLVSKINITKE